MDSYEKNSEELTLINGELIDLFIYVIAFLISIIVLYNKKLAREYKKTIYDSKYNSSITLINRLLILGLTLYFIYSNYRQLQLNKNEDEVNHTFTIQLIASILITISALLALYVAFVNYPSGGVSNVGNPEV